MTSPFVPSSDLESILECFLLLARAAGGARDTALAHRVAALLRRYLASRPPRAAALLHAHHATVQYVHYSALAALSGELALELEDIDRVRIQSRDHRAPSPITPVPRRSIPALSALQTSDTAAPASASPPPHALLALQRRNDTPENLHWLLQVTFTGHSGIKGEHFLTLRPGGHEDVLNGEFQD